MLYYTNYVCPFEINWPLVEDFGAVLWLVERHEIFSGGGIFDLDLVSAFYFSVAYLATTAWNTGKARVAK